MSCPAPIRIPSTGSAYKDSLHQLLAYIGLTGYGTDNARMPPRAKEEQDIVDAHLAAIERDMRAHAERNKNREFQNHLKRKAPGILSGAMPDPEGNDTATIYLSLEETAPWRAFIAGIPAEQRHTAAARRRLSLVMWRAHKKDMCLYCWLPIANCMCATLEKYRQRMPSAMVDKCSPVTILLHPEEMMRSTNSGHIAALLLDAPIRVWGVPLDDAYLAGLTPREQGPRDGSGNPTETLHAVLYPAKGAETVETFITSHLTPSASRGEVPPQRVHLILLDSTWPQAHSLNRHIAQSVPRVSLHIPESYAARFARLRKRTRESGVSTLEATSMAVEQCLQAIGKSEDAAAVTLQLLGAMEEFVDLRCLLKFTDVEFTKDAVMVHEVTRQRDAARREEAMKRTEMLEAKVKNHEEARRLLPPPICNYCYCCDRPIGWHRMAEHVLGRTHRAALQLNPTSEPSEASRGHVVPDYSRPLRQRSGVANPIAEPRVKRVVNEEKMA